MPLTITCARHNLALAIAPALQAAIGRRIYEAADRLLAAYDRGEQVDPNDPSLRLPAGLMAMIEQDRKEFQKCRKPT